MGPETTVPGLLKMNRLVIPTLQPELRQIGTCVQFQTASSELLAWIEAHQCHETVSQFQLDGGEEAWLELTLGKHPEGEEEDEEDTMAHFHIEVYRGECPVDIEELGNFDDSMALISEFIQMTQKEDASTMSRAILGVERKDLPEKGMVAKLLDFHKTACGSRFSLCAATLDIEDDWFDKLDIEYDEDEDEVNLRLFAFATLKLDLDYFKRMCELMAVGVDCFVFENASREQIHASG